MEDSDWMQWWAGTCPDCGIRITLEGELPLGRLLVCPICNTGLEFVEATPDWLDWASGIEPPEYEVFEGDWARLPV